MKPAVVIAAYNEHKHIAGVVSAVRAQGYEAIVVDDGSRDDTSALAIAAGAYVLRHRVNLGKGAAMKSGADYAFSTGSQAVIFMDGDGQHHPEELKKFESALKKTEVVFGYRHRTAHMPAMLRFGNWFLSHYIKFLFGLDIIDSQCGYRAMNKEAYSKLRWTSRDYSVESEMIANTGKKKLRHKQIEIATIYHDKYKGTTPLDGIPIALNLLWWRLSR